MTHPHTPPEKVELKPCPFCGGETISTHSQDMTEGPAYFWHKCETCGAETEGDYGEAEAASMWNRRTALASGSGDHAELVASLRKPEIWQSYPGPEGDFEVRLDPFKAADALEALLAENAALRGERDEADRRAGAAERELVDKIDSISKRQRWLRNAKEARGYHQNVSFDRVWSETCAAADRATQAERQRDELRKALEPFAEAAESLDDETRDHDHIWEQPAAMSIDAGHLRAARTFLSKEAERG